MLVIHVPERRLPQDARDVGQLEEHEQVAARADRAADHAQEVSRARDVLERVAAQDAVGLEVRVLLAVQVADEHEALAAG